MRNFGVNKMIKYDLKCTEFISFLPHWRFWDSSCSVETLWQTTTRERPEKCSENSVEYLQTHNDRSNLVFHVFSLRRDHTFFWQFFAKVSRFVVNNIRINLGESWILVRRQEKGDNLTPANNLGSSAAHGLRHHPAGASEHTTLPVTCFLLPPWRPLRRLTSSI